MKKNNPILKALLVLIVVSIFGYLNLDVPRDYVEGVVETQLESLDEETSEKGTLPDATYQVLSVIDGDTIVVSIDGEKQTVRVLGIDTPETEFSPAGAECYGLEASNKAKLLVESTLVTLQSDSSQSTTDAYDRLLAYVTTAQGQDFGEIMIRQGFAKEYTYKGNAHMKQSLYRQAEKEAQREELGVWACK